MTKPLIGCIGPYNKDTDTYNLASAYVSAIKAGGGIPLLIPTSLPEADMAVTFKHVDGLLLPGGGDIEPHVYGGQPHETLSGLDANRDKTEIFLAQRAFNQQVPVLAICRGIQVFNVALGGTIWEDINAQVPKTDQHQHGNDWPRNHLAHTVLLEPRCRLAAILGDESVQVNSLHHQAVRDVAPSLRVTGYAPDGVIEAVEALSHPFAIGVQWHPECLIKDDEAMLNLFKAFVKAAKSTR